MLKRSLSSILNAALFTIPKIYKQLKYPLTGEWIKKGGAYTQLNTNQPLQGMNSYPLK